MTVAAIVFAAGLQTAAPDTAAPTAIEYALVEYQCRATRAINGAGSDADQKCYAAQLAALRAEFGRDLARVSITERKTLDSACGQYSEPQKRDAYVDCLATQLTAMRARRSRGKPAPGTPAAAPDLATTPPVTPAPATAAPPVVAAPALWSSNLVFIVAGAAAVLLGAGALMALRGRAAKRKCRLCGEAVTGTGDLCPKCRHDAAEAARRSSSQRTETERIDRDRLQRLAALQEEQRREQARKEEEERARKEEETVRLQRQAHDRKDEEARTRQRFGFEEEEAFDPHAVLGVSKTATREEIDAAYEAGKKKYDLEQVSHLGPELQEHYKTKAAAVERAFKALTE